MNWTAHHTSSDQGLVIDEAGKTIAVAYDAKDTALLAAAPLLLKALYRITHPAADESDLEFALEAIDIAKGEIA